MIDKQIFDLTNTAKLIPLTILFFASAIYFIPVTLNANSKDPKAMHEKQVSERYKQGWEKLKQVDGKAGEQVIQSLKDIAPDMAKYTIEFPFGDIYARPGLDLKSREIATIAALTALGNATPQLKVHIRAGLNVGLTKQEIIEVIMQMSVYAGFPSALNGIFAAKEVFEEIEG